MSSIMLVHLEETVTVPTLQAMTKWNLFQNNPTLLTSPYQIQSPVSLSIFREFISAFEGKAVEITDATISGLYELCEELGFKEFEQKLSEFHPSMSLEETEAEDSDPHGRIAALEENAQRQDRVIVVLHNKVTQLVRNIGSLSREISTLRSAASTTQTLSGEVSALKIEIAAIPSDIAVLQEKLTQLSTDFVSLAGEVSGLRSAAAGIETLSKDVSALKTQTAQKLSTPIVEQLSTDFNELRKEVLIVKTQIAGMETPPIEQQLSPEVSKLQKDFSAVKKHIVGTGSSPIPSTPNHPRPSSSTASKPSSAVRLFDSQIISDFPEIFAEFRGKCFKILWRGSRDGFTAREFHGRCDGHANTLTVILDTNGNIFGGFTPLKWESPTSWEYKRDEKLKSFLFTIKNPHNISPRRCLLKAEKKDQAIICSSISGPNFNDIRVSDNCNTNTKSSTQLDYTYTKNTGRSGEEVLTGSQFFKVQEIEVFEITN
jgi:archaellum component FlaC